MKQIEIKYLIKEILLKFFISLLLLGLLILLFAGTFNFWQVYTYCGILIVSMLLVILYFLRIDPEFLFSRLKIKEKEKSQKIFQILFFPIFLSSYFICGLDHRYSWSHISFSVNIIADIVVILGYLIVFLVFKQNRYASRIIEVTEEQKVISDGFYRFVRHPMYIGVLIMYLFTPIALGSYWGLIPMVFVSLGIVYRIFCEEKILLSDLSGYEEYCQKTKYRLIPFIW